jgi:carbohydrate-binding DOMON domain-containing protein
VKHLGLWTIIGSLATSTLFCEFAAADTLKFKDPAGDDNGGGKTEYPTGGDYKPGSFDMVGLEIKDDGDHIVFEIQMAKKVTDPWKSTEWRGNGFSLQFAQIYLDTDSKRRKGERKGLPGSWVAFTPDSYWEKVIIVSPQPASMVRGEIAGKAAYLKSKIVIPARTEARGKKLIARVAVADLGSKPTKKWGIQVLMLSNEGFPAREDLLSRKVNELPGEHRFGGGCDGYGDPHVIDMLAGQATGDANEAQLQHAALSKFKCSDEPKKARVTKISAVRR